MTAELPTGVVEAHVLLVEQIFKSSQFEDRYCVQFKNDYIECSLKDEKLRPLLDSIYAETRDMLVDYLDLSNLVPRLKTFVGTALIHDKEMEQKFRILYSATQAQRDFKVWTAEAIGDSGYSISVVFLDIDDFKRLNSELTESVVDKKILAPFQELLKRSCRGRGAAYRHGGEEFLLLLPNHALDEASAFAEKLRSRIAVEEFKVDEHLSKKITVSAGVSALPKHGMDLPTLVEKANRAENLAKQDGKNCVRTC